MLKYKESRTVGYEAEAKADEKKQAAREAAISEKKLTAEEFDKAFEATPKAFYKQIVTDLDGCAKAIQELDAFGQQKFGDAAPGYGPLSQALEEVQDAARQLLEKRLQTDPDPIDAVAGDGGSGPAGGGAAGPLAPEPTSVEDAAGRIASAAISPSQSGERTSISLLMSPISSPSAARTAKLLIADQLNGCA